MPTRQPSFSVKRGPDPPSSASMCLLWYHTAGCMPRLIGPPPGRTAVVCSGDFRRRHGLAAACGAAAGTVIQLLLLLCSCLERDIAVKPRPCTTAAVQKWGRGVGTPPPLPLPHVQGRRRSGCQRLCTGAGRAASLHPRQPHEEAAAANGRSAEESAGAKWKLFQLRCTTTQWRWMMIAGALSNGAPQRERERKHCCLLRCCAGAHWHSQAHGRLGLKIIDSLFVRKKCLSLLEHNRLAIKSRGMLPRARCGALRAQVDRCGCPSADCSLHC